MAGKPGDPNEEAELLGEEEVEDAGLLDDEGGDEAEAGQEPSDAEAEEGLDEPQPSRASRRIQTLREQARQSAEHAARVERELNDLKAQRAQIASQPQEETEEQFRARLSLMTQDERVDARLERSERVHRREMAMTQFTAADAADRAAFEVRAASSPRRKKYAQEVENLLSAERRAGRNFPRETIYRFILGEVVDKAEGKPSSQRKAAEQRVQRQQARTSGGGSDRASPRQSQRRFDPNDMSAEAVEHRLSQPGVFI